MAKTHIQRRYEVGYNKPVEGAFGNSPQEYHAVGSFHDPLEAIAEVDELRKSSEDVWGRKAFILDTKYNGLATIVTGPGSLATRLITYVDGKKVDMQPSVIGSDGKQYAINDPSIPG
jgi:hypothetical protein